ncbi:MAG: ABC transporter substrate-binding protein [Oscillospiraceae bacterium]|nr:ABC transporter substrate-binding protein [Oscillospiraceae bacterium]
MRVLLRCKVFVIILNVVLAISLLAGCGGSQQGGAQQQTTAQAQDSSTQAAPPAGKTNIEFWNGFSGPDGKQMEVIVNAYNQQSADYNCTMQILPWDEYWEKITAGAQSGILPEVGVVHYDDITKFAKLGVLNSVDDLASKLSLSASDYPPGYWENSVVDGSMYGIPLDFHPVVMFYNKKLLAEAGVDVPKTGEEFIDACLKITKGDQYGTAVPVSDNAFLRPIFSRTLLYQFGGKEMNPDGKTYCFNSPEGVAALQWLIDLIYEYKVSPENLEDAVTMFTSNKVGFLFTGPWQILGFDENTDLDYGVAEMPLIGSNRVVWSGSHQLVKPVKKVTAEQAAAADDFIAYLIDNNIEWAKAGQVPALNKARESAEFKALEKLVPIAAEFNYIKLAQNYPWYSDGYSYIFHRELAPALMGEMSAQEALDNCVDYCNKMTAELVEKFGG